MDCYFASRIYTRNISALRTPSLLEQTGNSLGGAFTRIFKILAIGRVDEVTLGLRKYSFTKALIDSLVALKEEFKNTFFTTQDLHKRILVKQPNMPLAL